MKKLFCILSFMAVCFTACSAEKQNPVEIVLSDNGITIDGAEISRDSNRAVYAANDIVFYLENQGEDYGDGEKQEEHSQAEADKHTVVHITQPGDYIISGNLSAGQIAVDLGKEAKNDPKSRVNITLNNADITCSVAPAIICYNAYECGTAEIEKATKDVDTSRAGFNIIIADGSVNNINGSHVAKIFDENGKKQHKYDAGIESLVSVNINGNDGVLNLTADNEGIETKMHLTVNGGNININSMDDALNAGEDGVSVITINGGNIYANANNDLEGDGIDSNGWLVINGGSVSAFANEKSMDSGLDSDNGIYINGGTVFATGNMYDSISKDSRQNVVVFNCNFRLNKEDYLLLKSDKGEPVAGLNSPSGGTVTVYSSPQLTEGEYTLYKAGGVTAQGSNGIYTEVTDVRQEVQLVHYSPAEGKDKANPDRGGFEKGEIPRFSPDDIPRGSMQDRPQPPQGDMPPFEKGEKPDFEKGDFPADMPKPGEERLPPEGGQDFFREYTGRLSSSDMTTVFGIEKGVNIFRNVKAAVL